MGIQYKDEQFFTCCAIGRDDKGVLYIRSYAVGGNPAQLIRLKPAETLAITEHMLLRAQQPNYKPAKNGMLTARPARRRPAIIGFGRPVAKVVRLPEPTTTNKASLEPHPVRVRRPVEIPPAPVRIRVRVPAEPV